MKILKKIANIMVLIFAVYIIMYLIPVKDGAYKTLNSPTGMDNLDFLYLDTKSTKGYRIKNNLIYLNNKPIGIARFCIYDCTQIVIIKFSNPFQYYFYKFIGKN